MFGDSTGITGATLSPEEELRRILAVSKAPAMGAPPAPAAPAAAPTPAPIATPNQPPPIVPQQRQIDEAALNEKKNSPAGIDTFRQKHPILGTIAKIGEIAGSSLFPSIAAQIPGTELHHNADINRAQGRLNQDLAGEGKQAQTAGEEATAGETTARTGLVDAQTDALRNPAEKWEPVAGFQGPNGEPLEHDQTSGHYRIADVAGATPITKPEATAAPHVTYDSGIPVTVTGADKKVYDINDPKLPPELKPLVDAANRAHGQHVSEDAQKQAQIFAQQNSRQDKAETTSSKEKALTYWQPTLDSAERVNVMAKNYEDAVKNHDQQAMLSLLANHLGMTMGLQKGARLNQAIISEAQKSQPWLQGLAAKFDKDGYLSGVTLSPPQMKQMLDLGFERYREDVKKSRSQANYIGITDEPPRELTKEGARYYKDAAGGDVNRARQMAQQDGWNF